MHDVRSFFQGRLTALDGWRLLAHGPALPDEGLHRHERRDKFPFSYMTRLSKPWLVRHKVLDLDLSALLPTALAVGRRQQSESIEVALDK